MTDGVAPAAASPSTMSRRVAAGSTSSFDRALDSARSLTSADMPIPSAPQPMDEARAILVLNRDFGMFDTAAHRGSRDQIVSRDDLRAVRDNPAATWEQRAAADYLVTHDEAFDGLDTAAEGGSTDGFISRKDVTVHAIRDGGALPLLQSRQVDGSGGNPIILHIDAQAPSGAAWGNTDGSNAGIVSVYVDGRYYADATILSENPEGVDVNLGALGDGPHTIELRDSTAIGTGNQGAVSDVRASTRQLDMHASGPQERDAALAARYAPVVHLEDNGQAGNNVPLLSGAQVRRNDDGTTTISYSVLYSNEDGGDGAEPGRLNGKWGRNTDDESVFSVTVDDRSGEVVGFDSKSLGEGASHWEVDANGRPVVTVVNGHNQYGWASDHPHRARNRAFSGAPIVTPDKNTISLMNDHPWTWTVSTAEMRREGKLDEGRPHDRLYLNLVDGRGSDFKDVDRIQVVLNDGRVVTVGKYHAGGLFNIGDNRLNSSNNVSVALPEGIDPADVAEVRIEGLPVDAQVQAQRLDRKDDLPVGVPVGG
ncbi:hypothetical protein [Inquilinus limosus]|uniref:hypothetical protein n=1 Tax=Inquilinus limosus TaxID=171674 RepID=UPI00119821CE|nr:hypothetical protein [Inquilinus limosus]